MTAMEMCGELERQKNEGVPFDRLLTAAVELRLFRGMYRLRPVNLIRTGFSDRMIEQTASFSAMNFSSRMRTPPTL